jgi:hypothetical protein
VSKSPASRASALNMNAPEPDFESSITRSFNAPTWNWAAPPPEGLPRPRPRPSG